MIKLPPDFNEFLNLLTKNEVRFLLIGSYAAGVHGHVRATNDIDFWIEANEANAKRAESALREFGYDLPELTPDLLLRPGKITRMGVPPMRIEILNAISGVEFGQAYANRLMVDIDGQEIPVIGLRDLIQNKRAAGRTKDLFDVEELERALQQDSSADVSNP